MSRLPTSGPRSLLGRARGAIRRRLAPPPPRPAIACRPPAPARNAGLKVFGIGLSRTGTTSLARALELLGLETRHFRDPELRRLVRLEDALFLDAVTDVTMACQFETLERVFPQAKFVYTVRPLEGWLRSMERHFEGRTPRGLRDRLHAIAAREDVPPGAGYEVEPFYHAVMHALYTGHESWEAAWHAHDARVRAHFADRPEKLLVFDVGAAGHGWAELCGFLGRPVPDRPFPHLSWVSGRLVEPGATAEAGAPVPAQNGGA